DRVAARIGDAAQGQAVGRALVDAGGAADADAGRHVVDRDTEGIGPVEEGAVLIDQVDGDGAVGGTIGVGVALGAVAGIGVGVAVTPVHDVAADRVTARIGDAAQGQAVGRALVDVGGAADGNRRGHVV